MIWFILVIFVIFFSVSLLYGLLENKSRDNPVQKEITEQEELTAVHKQERIDILDNTLVQYIKLLDSLAAQLKEETNEKKRAVLLSKQIATLEKYNRALEKREKLDS